MAEALGYFLTWTTYGTWLRGDTRGWVDKRRACPGTPFESHDAARIQINRHRMTEPPYTLDPGTRQVVEAAVRETCVHRGWQLHEVSARSSHVHAVVTAPVAPERVIADLKAYATRAIRRLCTDTSRSNWWSEGGSTRYLNTDASLIAAIEYVRNQDVPH